MLIVDSLAYTNKYFDISPYKKTAVSLIFIFMSITAANIYFLCAMITTVVLFTLFGAGIPRSTYFKMIVAPAVYLLISIFTVIFSFGFSNNVNSERFVYIKQFELLNFYIGLSAGSLEKGLILGLRSLSGITGMYFLILTTPCAQQVKVMKKVKIPAVFIELYVLTYRFIAILFEEASLIYTAQNIRFGYNNYKNSMNSLSVLIKILFVRIMVRYKDMEAILETRHFDGTFYMD